MVESYTTVFFNQFHRNLTFLRLQGGNQFKSIWSLLTQVTKEKYFDQSNIGRTYIFFCYLLNSLVSPAFPHWLCNKIAKKFCVHSRRGAYCVNHNNCAALPQFPGRLFSPSDISKKLSHHILVHFPIGMGSYDCHKEYQGVFMDLLQNAFFLRVPPLN